MADWPADSFPVGHTIIGTISALSAELLATAGTLATSRAWPTGSKALFVPVPVGAPVTVVQMFIYNGAAVSGNVDVGIYDSQGNRIVSKGSTAQAGTSAPQAFDITDTLLMPGLYYFGVALDNTTGTIHGHSGTLTANYVRSCGLFEMAAAFALPATATFAATSEIVLPGVYAAVEAVL